MTKKIGKIEKIFMFYHFKPRQSWQVVPFHSYNVKKFKQKMHLINFLNLTLDLRPLKMNTYYIKRNQFCKEPPKGLI
jgi:hypothetical protein